ncbi:dienelactone hydrolase family protein [Plectonema radiosum NIES-515]|uniref:Dienelactone hydrolase family protein n=1 Tax=Plectonema radiosum NIES-515 TaxID=2986073 RepID=A0ABT3B6F5_9CYAN|nr:dienelactone hydrolase family protein [Plectonema radiosum]MCV3216973.1 dienelactone hydrolase family protein [Plectonema radiosum NIES-515]
MKGRMIEFNTSNGQVFSGYLSIPEKGKGPGAIVLQEWWGLVDHIKQVCDRLAAFGFTALAPDMYKGEQTDSPDQADRLMMALGIDESEQILQGAIKALLANQACTSKKVGTVGFCLGGQLSLYAAAADPDMVSACVDFYGIHPNVNPPIENIKAPVLGFFGEKDPYVTMEAVRELKKNLDDAGKTAIFYTYPDADHAFFNDTDPNYHQQAAEDAWRHLRQFLAENIS